LSVVSGDRNVKGLVLENLFHSCELVWIHCVTVLLQSYLIPFFTVFL